MVAEAANTVISVLRGTVVDAYGDTADAVTPVIVNLPAILAETSQQVLDPATQQPRIIRAATCKVPAWAGVLTTDQITDATTGNVYIVTDVITPPTFICGPAGGLPDTVLALRRVTAASP